MCPLPDVGLLLSISQVCNGAHTWLGEAVMSALQRPGDKRWLWGTKGGGSSTLIITTLQCKPGAGLVVQLGKERVPECSKSLAAGPRHQVVRVVGDAAGYQAQSGPGDPGPVSAVTKATGTGIRAAGRAGVFSAAVLSSERLGPPWRPLGRRPPHSPETWQNIPGRARLGSVRRRLGPG